MRAWEGIADAQYVYWMSVLITATVSVRTKRKRSNTTGWPLNRGIPFGLFQYLGGHHLEDLLHKDHKEFDQQKIPETAGELL